MLTHFDRARLGERVGLEYLVSLYLQNPLLLERGGYKNGTFPPKRGKTSLKTANMAALCHVNPPQA